MNRCRRHAGSGPRPAIRGRRAPCAAYHIETVKRGIRVRALCAARAWAMLPPCVSGREPARTPKTACTPGNRASAFERTQAPGRAANQRSNGFVNVTGSGSRRQNDAENA
ncbi:hypothetical protein C6Q14_28080 [Burkholderia ambifaria]|nr:hypothetical protein C6Q14_28080 [Burkholderia ambifaria]